jgi:sugar O-acyltransferase (sialic acid O-acetyltransferase NeuD family)
VVGAGGHGKTVADILICQGIAVLGFLDDDQATWGGLRLGKPVLGPIEAYRDFAPVMLGLGIGDNQARRRVIERLGAQALVLWCTAVHPRAIIAASAQLGRGAVIAAGAVVNPDAIVGDYAIINTGATVDHDCRIGHYAHIAPGAHLSGRVRIRDGALLGIGSVVAPGCSVGAWSIVGAGAAVVRDIPDWMTAMGVPARWQHDVGSAQ